MVTDRGFIPTPHVCLFVLIQGLLIHPYQAGPRTKKFLCPAVSLSRDKSSRKNPGTNSSVPGKIVKKKFLSQKLQFIFLFCKCFSKIFYYPFKQMKDEDFFLYCKRVVCPTVPSRDVPEQHGKILALLVPWQDFGVVPVLILSRDSSGMSVPVSHLFGDSSGMSVPLETLL